MKKIMIALVCLLMLSTVAALEVDVVCDGGWFNTDICRDNELEEEFDAVTDYVNDNEGSWLKDLVGGGTSFSKVQEYLMNEFLDFLDDRYLPRIEQCETYNYLNQQSFWDVSSRVKECGC